MKEVATIAVMDGNKMLWGKRRDSGRWTTPGGHLNPGEDRREGAARELWEEAGIRAPRLIYLGSLPVVSEKGEKILVHAYKCPIPEGCRTTMKGDPDKEVHRWQWIDMKDGCPKHIMDNMHCKKNVLMALLNYQTWNEFRKTVSVGHGAIGAPTSLVGGATGAYGLKPAKMNTDIAGEGNSEKRARTALGRLFGVDDINAMLNKLSKSSLSKSIHEQFFTLQEIKGFLAKREAERDTVMDKETDSRLDQLIDSIKSFNEIHKKQIADATKDLEWKKNNRDKWAFFRDDRQVSGSYDHEESKGMAGNYLTGLIANQTEGDNHKKELSKQTMQEALAGIEEMGDDISPDNMRKLYEAAKAIDPDTALYKRMPRIGELFYNNHENLPADMVDEVLDNYIDRSITSAAVLQDKLTPEQIHKAIRQPRAINSAALNSLVRRQDLNKDHINGMIDMINDQQNKSIHVGSHAENMNQLMLSPQFDDNHFKKILQSTKDGLTFEYAINNHRMTPDLTRELIESGDYANPGMNYHSAQKDLQNLKKLILSPKAVDEQMIHGILDGEFKHLNSFSQGEIFDNLVDNKNFNAEHADKVINRQYHAPEDGTEGTHKYLIDKILGNSNLRLTPEHLNTIIDDENMSYNNKVRAIKRPEVDNATLDKAITAGIGDLAEAAIMNPNANESHIQKGLEHDDPGVRTAAAKKASVGQIENILNNLSEDNQLNEEHGLGFSQNPNAKNYLRAFLTHPGVDDDLKSAFLGHGDLSDEDLEAARENTEDRATGSSYLRRLLGEVRERGLHQDDEGVEFSLGTHKIRHARDIAEESGGSIHKKALEDLGLNPKELGINHLLGPKGDIHALDIRRHLHEMPKMKFGVTHGEWGNAPADAENLDPSEMDPDDLGISEEDLREEAEQDVYEGYPITDYFERYGSIDDIDPHGDKVSDILYGGEHDWEGENPDFDTELDKKHQGILDHDSIVENNKIHINDLAEHLKAKPEDAGQTEFPEDVVEPTGRKSLYEHMQDLGIKDVLDEADEQGYISGDDLEEHMNRANPENINYADHDSYSIHAHPDYKDRERDAIREVMQNVTSREIPDSIWDDYHDHLSEQIADRIQELKKEKMKDPQSMMNILLDSAEEVGEQRHNHENSRVFQLNMTPEHTKQMKKEGVWETFKRMHEATERSGHPVSKGNGIGWVRYTKKDDGYHIDEIQSDFGQSFVKQAKAQAREAAARGQITQSQAEQAGKDAEEKWSDNHFQKISNILFGGKHPNNVIHEAFHQYLRDQGEAGKKIAMHTDKERAKLSGMNINRKLPGHINEAYNKYPKKMGYTEATYGDIKTQSNPRRQGNPTQMVTLRKKMEELRTLLKSNK